MKNYRPISLLPICGKMFENIILNNIYSYLNANNLITKNQSGFRPGNFTQVSPNHPQLIFNVTHVAKVNEQKHLGLILQPGLSFGKHLNEKIIKAKKNIGLFLSKFLPLKTLDQMYKALVRSHLDCDVIYHIPSIIHQPPRYYPKFSNGECRKNSITSRSCNYWCLARF